MVFLYAFAFIGGIVTILSPCILPILPIILSSAGGSKAKPFGIIAGFITSFTFFTLFLANIVEWTGIPADYLRFFSIFVIGFFGLTLLIPQFQKLTEKLFSKLSSRAPKNTNRKGFWGGLIIGLSLGLLWTPCVGPILAGVITLAIAGEVTRQTVFITLAYAAGTAIPMLIILRLGGRALESVPWLVKNTGKIQKTFGVLMIATAIMIYFNIDRKFQSYILTTFPQYGAGLTSIEDNAFVRQALEGVTGLDYGMGSRKNEPSLIPADKAVQAPEIVPGGQWINSEPLTLEQLAEEDKVVLVDFWTYSCINCIRTMPYLRNWWEKYEDDGLVIIGVHTPEFAFEQEVDNVRTAAEDFKLTYPIVQDNNYATWNAFNNKYWPAKYLIDKDGKVRYFHFGEGAYEETEGFIQDLLEETGTQVDESIMPSDYQVTDRSPETYLGYKRIEGFASPEAILKDDFQDYSLAEGMSIDTFSFEGQWRITDEYAESREGSDIVFYFASKEVYLVMKSEIPAEVRVHLDGQVISPEFAGEDVDEDGIVTVEKDRLYRIINLPEYGSHVLWLEFLDPGVKAFAFTFG